MSSNSHQKPSSTAAHEEGLDTLNANRTKTLSLRLTEQEFDELEHKAHEMMISKAELVRRVLYGLKLHTPPSAENLKGWRELGQVGSNINQCAKQLHVITRELALIEQQIKDAQVKGIVMPSTQRLDNVATMVEHHIESIMPILNMMRDALVGKETAAPKGTSK